MSRRGITIAGIAGASMTALFAYLTSPEAPREGVVLNPEATARLLPQPAATQAALTALTAQGAASQPEASQSFAATAALSPHAIAEAKRYLKNYNLSGSKHDRYQTLLSVFRQLKSDPRNAHHIDMTPEQLVARIKMEAGQYANSASGLVDVRRDDGAYPNEESFYRVLSSLQEAESYLSLDVNGQRQPGTMWEHIMGPRGPLTGHEFNSYKREIEIAVAQQQFEYYQTRTNGPVASQLEHLERVDTYARLAWFGSGDRDTYKEIGISSRDLQALLQQLKDRRDKEVEPSGP